MATVQEAVRRLTIVSTDRGLTETERKLRGVQAAQQGVAVTAERQERATLSLQRRVDGLSRQYDRHYRAASTLSKVERDLAAAHAQGLITLKRKNELLALATAQTDRATVATGRLAAAQRGLSASGGAALGAVGLGGGFAVGGILAAGFAVSAFVKNSIEAQKTLAQLEAAIKSTGGAAGLTSGELTAMASDLQRVTTYGDDAVIAAQAMLLTFTSIGRDVFPDAVRSILDLSTAMGQDLKSSTVQVGKALNDPVKGISALTRVGIQFTEAQKLMIKSLAEANDMAGAQRIILGELERQFGGSARAARDTLGGALTALGNAFGDLFEVSGEGSANLVRSINALNDALSDPATIAAVQALGGAIFDTLADAVRDVVALINEIKALAAVVDSIVDAARNIEFSPNYTLEQQYRSLLELSQNMSVSESQRAAAASGAAKVYEQLGVTGVSGFRSLEAASMAAYEATVKTADGTATVTTRTAALGSATSGLTKEQQRQQNAISGVIESLKFQADQLERTAREQTIYNALRQAGTTLDTAAGREIASLAGGLYDAEAAQKALNASTNTVGKGLEFVKDAAVDAGVSIAKAFLNGEASAQKMADTLHSLRDTLADSAIRDLMSGNFVSAGIKGVGAAIAHIFGNRAQERAEAQAKREEQRLRREEKRQDEKDRLLKREQKIIERQEMRAGYTDRAFVAGLDTSTEAGRLAQFDREAQREREELERKVKNADKLNRMMARLDKALAAERLKIQQDFHNDMIAEAKRAADEMNRTALSIVDYVNSLKAGSDSPLSPVDRFAAAQSAYQAQIGLAQGGNAAALGSITQYSDAYLKAAREMYASSQDFFTIFDTVTAQLLALPTVQNATDPAVAAMLQVLDAVLDQTSVLQAQTATLAGAIDAGPAATANALGPVFDNLDIDVSGGITLAEMQAALGTTNARLLQIFQTLDADGDGQISRLEQISAATGPLAAWLNTVNNTTAAVNAGVASVNAGVDGVNNNVGKTDESGLKSKIKDVTSAVGELKSGTKWLPVMAQRLYEVALFTGMAKGVKEKPKKGDDRTAYANKDKYLGFASGGVIPGLASGGMVGNGVWNQDSVRARYAGGGDIALAGGEGVINAAATSMIGPSVIDLINRTGRLPDNDNGRHFDTQNRVLLAGFRAMVEEVTALREEVRMLRADTQGTTRAIRDKPVPKPATKAA